MIAYSHAGVAVSIFLADFQSGKKMGHVGFTLLSQELKKTALQRPAGRLNNMGYKHQFVAAVFAMSISTSVNGQQVECDSVSFCGVENESYKFEWRKTILPASLITAGAICLAPSFIRNGSRSVTEGVIDIRGQTGRLEFDDYLQYAPVVGAFSLGALGVKARHDLGDRTLIIATSYATLGVLTNVPKYFVNEQRPEFAGRNSFPSGHTATVFMGAELIRIEYGGLYGIGAYAVAVGVGFMRMYNGRHWLHDVVAGAGVGIISARIGEWSCPMWRKLLHIKDSRTKLTLIPTFSPLNNNYGMAVACSF